MNDMGHIYVLSTTEGFYKIGCTSCPIPERINQFAPKLPFKTEVEFAFMCTLGQERRVEQLLHQRFAAKHSNGEWFRLTEEDLNWFLQNPLPLPIAVSHEMCFAQECLTGHSDDHLMQELLGLS